MKVELLNGDDISAVVRKVVVDENIEAPIKKGDIIGDIIYLKNGEEIARNYIKAEDDVKIILPKKSFFEEFWESFKHIFLKVWET